LLLDDTLSQALLLLISLLHEVSETILDYPIDSKSGNTNDYRKAFPMPFTTKSLYAVSKRTEFG